MGDRLNEWKVWAGELRDEAAGVGMREASALVERVTGLPEVSNQLHVYRDAIREGVSPMQALAAQGLPQSPSRHLFLSKSLRRSVRSVYELRSTAMWGGILVAISRMRSWRICGLATLLITAERFGRNPVTRMRASALSTS